MAVKVSKNNVDSALRRFKTELARNGDLSAVRERAFGYKKPGVKRREEKKKNTRNWRKNNRRKNG